MLYVTFAVLAVTVSSFTLTVTTLDRYCSAFHPGALKVTQGRQIIVIIVVWISGTLVSLPWLLYTHLMQYDLMGVHGSVCQAHFPSMTSRKAYTTFFSSVGYVIPVTIMFILLIRTMTKTVSTREPCLPVMHVNDQMKRQVSTSISISR